NIKTVSTDTVDNSNIIIFLSSPKYHLLHVIPVRIAVKTFMVLYFRTLELYKQEFSYICFNYLTDTS
ncbi:MAG TPA: hypothetical protein VHO68_14440, partial [Bacteroidales bacterium]|nr:hypothetical protein [Bacteroidales bacterium]